MENSPAENLTEPVREGYAFEGFYLNEDFSGEKVTEVYGPEGFDMTLYAKWSPVQYHLNAELNGGQLVEELPATFTVEDVIDLPEATKEHYNFLGWFMGDVEVEQLVGADLLANVEIEAVFEAIAYPIEFELDGGALENLPTSRTVEDSIVLGEPEKANHAFLGWYDNANFEGDAITTLDASNLAITKLFAKYEYNACVFIGEQGYSSIAAALAAAQDGDTITLLAMTFDEEVVITKAITLKGPNAGVKGYEERAAEAILKGTVKIQAAGVTLDGLRFEENGFILVSASDATIQNIYSISKTTKAGGSNRYAQIVADADISGLTVLDSYLNSGTNGNQKGNIASESIVKNILIKGNHLFNDVTSTGAICEAIEFYNLGAGTVEIIENEIRFNTDNFIIFMGNYSNNATSVVIKDNILAGSNAAETKHTAGVSVRYLGATAEYTFEHNYVYNMYGNTLDVRYGKPGAKMADLYNYYELAFKFTNKADVEISYEGNAYEAAQTTETPDHKEFSVYGIAELEAAYNVYKNAVALLNGQRFLTLAEALEAAQDGDTIQLFAKLIEEELDINKSVTILGPNDKVLGFEERADEAEFTKPLSISAANVTLKGVKLTGDAHIHVKADNFTLENCWMKASVIKAGGNNRKGMIINDSEIDGLKVIGNYLYAGGYLASQIDLSGVAKNVLIHNNYFTNGITVNNNVNEGIIIYLAKEELTITNNQFIFPTDNWSVLIYGAALSHLLLQDNVVNTANGVDHTSGWGIYNIPATCTVDVIHNKYYSTIGTTFRMTGGSDAATFNFYFNYFDENSPINLNTTTTPNWLGNSYGAEINPKTKVNPTDYRPYAEYDLEALEVAYQAWLNGVVNHSITYELNGGAFKVEAPTEYAEGVGVGLVAPERDGFTFLGWFDNPDFNGEAITSISTEANQDVVLYAKWEENLVPVQKDFTIGETGYDTLEDALAAAQDGDTIMIAAGEFELSKEIAVSKNVTIKGAGMDQTVFSGNASGKLTLAANVVIKDLTFVGPGATSSVSLVYSGAGMGDVVFENVKGMKYNSFFRASTADGDSIKFVNCEFSSIGQFFIWVYTASTVKTVEFVSSKMDLSNCGGVENTAASMFRMRAGSLYVYDSYFEGNLPSTTGGLFENGNSGAEAVIEFNTFKNVNKFDRNYNDEFKVLFNKNLYLDAAGNVLAGMDASEVKGSTIVDAVVAASEEERAAFYQAFLNGDVTTHTITYVLNGGEFKVDSPDNFIEGQGVALVNPAREGYDFLGWFRDPEFNGEAVTAISSDETEDVTLYAKWEEVIVDNKPIRIGNKGYDQIGEALEAAQDGDTITIAEGTYELASVINKSVKFVGAGRDLTIVNVTKDIASNINAANISFEKMSLVGPSAGYASGKLFQTGANAGKLSFDDCILKNVNTFIYVNASNQLEINVTNSHIEGISQFFIWTTASASVAKIHFASNIVDGDSCGATPNGAATFIRVRSNNTTVEVYDNYFKGTHQNENDGYFENGQETNTFIVKFNTFAFCEKIVHNNGGHPIVFDKNLYLNQSGAPLSETPSAAAKPGVQVDNILAQSEEERAAFYQAFLAGDNYTISYDLNGGEWDGAPGVESFQKVEEINTGTPKMEGFRFVGWFENDVQITEFEKRNYELVAHWVEEGIYVGVGELADYATLAEALAAAQENDVIIILPGTIAEDVTISINGLTIKGAQHQDVKANDSIIAGVLTIKANNVTLKNLQFVQGSRVLMKNNNDGLTFDQNYVHGIGNFKSAWVESTNSDFGFINCVGTNDDQVCDLVFTNNVFESVDDTCMELVRTDNVTIKNNVFKNFRYEALRIDGGYNDGTMIIVNNTIECDAEGAYAGIYFRTYGGHSDREIPTIYIAGNTFKNLGFNATVAGYAAAIAARNFQEYGIEWIISENDFINCKNYIKFRNNYDYPERFKTYSFTTIIEHNNFYGLPVSFIYSQNTTSSDTATACPAAGRFFSNFYADLDGNKVEPDFGMFISTVLVEEGADQPFTHENVSETPVTKVRVVLGENSHKDYAVEKGSSLQLEAVALEDHLFKGFFLNADFSGEAITELENVEHLTFVYAKFEQYVYQDIDYNLNGGQLPEGAPEQFVIGIGCALVDPSKEGNVFLGWYDNEDCLGKPVTSISADKTEKVTLFALWQDLSATYTLEYHLNGGTFDYNNYTELADDFLNDMNAINNASITRDNFTSKCRQEQFTTFLADDAMWAKWSWLFGYIQSIEENPSSVEIYKEVMESRTCESANWWFLTRDFAGFVNQSKNTFYYTMYPIDFSLYAVEEGIWDALSHTVTLSDVQALATPVRPYYTFLGWYEDEQCLGQPVKVLYKDSTLYAKWEKTNALLTYVVNNDSAILAETEVLVHAGDSFDLAIPEYNPKFWNFEGWYLDPEFTQKVTKINEYTLANVTVYGKWTELSGYSIEYHLNGGNWSYDSFQELSQAVLDDYNAWRGSSFTQEEILQEGAWAGINVADFYYSEGVADKWGWVFDYLGQVGGSANKKACSELKNYADKAKFNAANSNWIYAVSYELKGFMGAGQHTKNSNYKSSDYSDPELQNGVWPLLSAHEQSLFLNNKDTVQLLIAHYPGMVLVGWYDNEQFAGDPITEVDGSLESGLYVLYAKYEEADPVTDINIANQISELEIFNTHQLLANVVPENASITSIKYSSSNPNVATISNAGLITALHPGTTVIRLTSNSTSGFYKEFELTVFEPAHYEASYETVSYTTVGENIQLNAEFVKKDGTRLPVTLTSLNPEIATVSDNVATGVNAGTATIRASVEGDELTFDFKVNVISSSLSEVLQFVVSQHNSNAFIRNDLGIGAGTPAYYRDIVGSLSNIIYNLEYVINNKYYSTQQGVTNNHGGEKTSTEFITVHYTGNMSPKATAAANAEYFATGGGGTSIHYVTGNDGIFYVLDESLVAFHAGDGTGVEFHWLPTGIMVAPGDPAQPTIGIDSNSYYTVNGISTSIPVPTGTTTATKKVTDTRWFNDMGIGWTIINGEYHLATTWWCYTQISEGRICNKGGNNNSIGIESAVNPEADLWLTWEKTAQLVSDLVTRYNLDFTRVVGHHFYSAKDCPQPLLENDLEIWWIFMDMVKAEYAKNNTFGDYTFLMEPVDDVSGQYINFEGGRINQPDQTTTLTYKVTVTNTVTGAQEEVVLSTIVNGRFTK